MTSLLALLPFAVLSFGLSFQVSAQTENIFDYPDGVYATLEDFQNKNPDTNQHFKILHFTLPTGKAFSDTLTNNVWFLDENNDRIGKVFAIVSNSQLYFNDYGMKLHPCLGFPKMVEFDKYKFHRIIDRGRYMFGIRRHPAIDYTSGAMIGAQFGLIGTIIGSVIDEASPPKNYLDHPYIFDTQKRFFIMLDRRKSLQQFMDIFHPANKFDAEKGTPDIESVRELIYELNSQ